MAVFEGHLSRILKLFSGTLRGQNFFLTAAQIFEKFIQNLENSKKQSVKIAENRLFRVF